MATTEAKRMGRPPKHPGEVCGRTSITLPEWMWEAIDEMAAADFMGRTEWIRQTAGRRLRELGKLPPSEEAPNGF